MAVESVSCLIYTIGYRRDCPSQENSLAAGEFLTGFTSVPKNSAKEKS
jgi:hypothetical protein